MAVTGVPPDSCGGGGGGAGHTSRSYELLNSDGHVRQYRAGSSDWYVYLPVGHLGQLVDRPDRLLALPRSHDRQYTPLLYMLEYPIARVSGFQVPAMQSHL